MYISWFSSRSDKDDSDRFLAISMPVIYYSAGVLSDEKKVRLLKDGIVELDERMCEQSEGAASGILTSVKS
jgi:hypothetical protein